MGQSFKKVLITGIDSFTGIHLSKYLQNNDYDVYGTSLFTKSSKIYKCDITSKEDIKFVISKIKPDFIIHLAGISFAAFENSIEFYNVNTIGSVNILEAIVDLKFNPKKIILASSATVYGNQGLEVLDESLCPIPINHYGASKYSMESLAKSYFSKLNIVITRPFNYTGVGQSEEFLIPKIVKHFIDGKKTIELGNLNVSREFNDIGFVCEVYFKLLESHFSGEVINICSNRGIKLLDVISKMNKLAGYEIEIKINPAFVRINEINTLTGSTKKLFNTLGKIEQIDFENTLQNMYQV